VEQDLGDGNILSNWLRVPFRDEDAKANVYGVKPLRSRMPFRYYLIDFECAVVYDADTPAEQRLVTGLPVDASTRKGQYGRVPAPEMLTGERYCPFAADVFQLGVHFDEYFGVRPTCDLLGRLTPARSTSANCRRA
jgi:hypothetical protein